MKATIASAKKEKVENTPGQEEKQSETGKSPAVIDTDAAILDMLERMNLDMGKIRSVMEVQSAEIRVLKEGTPNKSNMQEVPSPSAETHYDPRTPAPLTEEERELRRKSRERRDSTIAADQLNREMDERLGEKVNVVATTVLHTQKEPELKEQIDEVSIPKLVQALDNQATFINRNGQMKTLVHFLTPKVHVQLIRNESVMGTDLSNGLTPATIYTKTDKTIIGMVVRYVRFNYTIEKNSFTRTIFGFTKVLKAKYLNWQFGIMDYDQMLHAQMVIWLKSMRRGWQFLTTDVTMEECRTWPKERMGPKEDPGILRIMMNCLGDFESAFERAVGMQKLKNMDSVDELLAGLEKANNWLCDKSTELRRDDAHSHEPQTLSQIRDQMNKASDYQRSAQRPTENGNPRFTENGSERKSAEIGNPRFGKPGYPSMPRYGNMDEHDDNMAATPPPSSEPKMVTGEWDPDESIDKYSVDEDLFDAELSELMGRGSFAIGSGGKTDPRQKAPPDPSKPCYQYFRGPCDGKCGYSHDDAKMEQAAYKQLESLLTSKYGGRDRTIRNMDKILLAQNPARSGPFTSRPPATPAYAPTRQPRANALVLTGTSAPLGPLFPNQVDPPRSAEDKEDY